MKNYYQEHKEKLKEQSRKWRQEHKKEKKAYDRKWRQEHKEEIRKYNKKYRQEHKESQKTYDKNRYHENKEKELTRNKKYHQEYKEKINKRKMKRHQKYPWIRNKQTRIYLLKKKHLFEDFSLEEWQQKVIETEGICSLCGRPYSEVHPFIPTLDHTPPISKAPINYTYTIDDVTPMCGSCNSSKSASF